SAESCLPRDRVSREIGVADDQTIAVPHRTQGIEHIGIEQRINGLQHIRSLPALFSNTVQALAARIQCAVTAALLLVSIRYPDVFHLHSMAKKNRALAGKL